MKSKIQNPKSKILICGFGGQGVIFAGELLGRAAIIAGREAAESSSYGSESRGSACHSGVVIADAPIAYPKVERPDILIALSQDSYDKFAPRVKPGGQIFFDCHLIKMKKLEGVDQTGIPAMHLATQLGRKGVANVVMLAAAMANLRGAPTSVGESQLKPDLQASRATHPNLPSREALEQALREQSPAAYLEVNLKAVEAGWGISEKVIRQQSESG